MSAPTRPLSDAPLFDRASLREDLLSGLTVALVGLPQCLAYAMMSGLPPAYGLVAAAVPGAIAALVGRSAQVITGPTNTTGLLILAALGPWLGESGLLTPAGLPVLAALTLMAGMLRVIGSYLGAAELLRFLPASVLVGFTAGAGLLIAVMQLDEALGIPAVRGGGLFREILGLAEAIGAGRGPAWPAVLTTLVTGGALVLGERQAKRTGKRWPMALLAVVLAMIAAYAFDLDADRGLPLVRDRSPIPRGWPEGALPSLDPEVWRDLLLPAAAIVFLGTLELTVTARSGGERPNMKRELLSQGVANVVGAFASAFPASASLTRSALLKLGGGRTRLAALSAALTVVPILLFGGDLVGTIPQACLAGVLFVTAYGMVDRDRIARMWRAGRETRVLLVVTFVATLTLPLEQAILLGAGLGLLMHLAKNASPVVVTLVPAEPEEGTPAGLRPLREGEGPTLVVFAISGSMHYAATSAFARRFRKELPASAERVILDLSHAQQMRYSAMLTFERLAQELKERGVILDLAGVDGRFSMLLASSASELRFTRWQATPGEALRAAIRGEAARAGGHPARPPESRPPEDEDEHEGEHEHNHDET